MSRGVSSSVIEDVRVRAATIPTDVPESDGTLEWDSTTIVVAQASAAGTTGIGWSYASAAAAKVVVDVLADKVRGRSTTPWYDAYRDTSSAWGLEPLADQHLAGVIMWVPAGLIYVIVGVLLVATWIRHTERQVGEVFNDDWGYRAPEPITRRHPGGSPRP